MTIRTKVLVPHTEGCGALEQVAYGWWDGPWCLLGDGFNGAPKAIYADSLCRTYQGHRRWLVAICNSSQCEGRLAVLEDDILAALPKD